jgi:methylenetetrahydrofolate dehydrogenase (NADP+)/methenyltetrahydrofolate cyclohydrolase
MTAKVMDGKSISKGLLKELKGRVDILKKRGIQPRLDIVLVGDKPASKIYVEKKIKSSGDIGIKAELHKFPKHMKKEKILKTIEKLNSDESVHGILVQLPLPRHLNEREIIDSVCPEKDVDGLTTYNLGNLFAGEAKFEPCTPKGVMKILDYYNIKIEGKNVVIVGRSNLVGKPLSAMFLKKNATVTVCHSKTKDLNKHTRNADILVVAVGKPNFITGEMIKNDSVVVVDVGINRFGGKVIGDVYFKSVEYKVSHITPVPGGVGPLTVAMVLENTIISAERSLQK